MGSRYGRDSDGKSRDNEKTGWASVLSFLILSHLRDAIAVRQYGAFDEDVKLISLGILK